MEGKNQDLNEKGMAFEERQKIWRVEHNRCVFKTKGVLIDSGSVRMATVNASNIGLVGTGRGEMEAA